MSQTPNIGPTIDNLPDFLKEVEDLFDAIIKSWGDLLFKEKYRAPLADAWHELKDRLPALRKELDHPSTDLKDRLNDAGLTGRQLEVKLLGINEAWQRFREYGSVRLLRRLLGFINDALGSLAAAVPGIEALDELKKIIERWLDGGD